MKGIVKRFNPQKGFGFIVFKRDGVDTDAFFHFSQIIMDGYKTIDVGSAVEFELVEGERGLQAQNIKKVED